MKNEDAHLVELLFKYILQTAPSSVKKLIFFKSGGRKSSRNMETVQPIKRNFLILGPV